MKISVGNNVQLKSILKGGVCGVTTLSGVCTSKTPIIPDDYEKSLGISPNIDIEITAEWPYNAKPMILNFRKDNVQTGATPSWRIIKVLEEA